MITHERTVEAVELVGTVLEVVGVAIIAVGVLAALVRGALQMADASRRAAAYRRTQQQVARSILLGLELLVAGDIVQTVAVTPSFVSIGVLGLIVLVRTFLSFTLTMEIDGRWPWQGERGTGPAAD